MATTSQPRSLLSIARLNMARSRARPSIWSFVRIDQTCLGRNGALLRLLCPYSRATAYGAWGSRLLDPASSYSSVREGEKHEPGCRNQVSFRATADFASGPARRATGSDW